MHRLIKGRKLIIGGVDIPFPVGEAGHSDGDVLIHAIIDALLGACAQGDIGSHFPPRRSEFKGISSRILLKKAVEIIKKAGYEPYNLDSTVILERPELLTHIPAMISVLSKDLCLDKEQVSVKAKTREGLGHVGKGKAVEAYAVVLVKRVKRLKSSN